MSLIKVFLDENNSGISVFLDRGRTLLRQVNSQLGTIYSSKVEVFLTRKSLISDIIGFLAGEGVSLVNIFNSAGYIDLPHLNLLQRTLLLSSIMQGHLQAKRRLCMLR
jgi:hypothetical protein